MGLLYLNNSQDENYHKQTNNVRNPGITCFPTSMINASYALIPFGVRIPNDEAKTGYKQEEDQYDYFIHTDPRVHQFAIDNKCLNANTELRELWNVEEFAFNTWVGRNVCKLTFNLKPKQIIDVLNRAGSVVTSGVFCGLAHVVCIVGYEATIPGDADIIIDKDNAADPIVMQNIPKISDTLDEIKNIVIDDSYGNMNNHYNPRGVGGNDVRVPFKDFLAMINKGSSTVPLYRGILFDPTALA